MLTRSQSKIQNSGGHSESSQSSDPVHQKINDSGEDKLAPRMGKVISKVTSEAESSPEKEEGSPEKASKAPTEGLDAEANDSDTISNEDEVNDSEDDDGFEDQEGEEDDDDAYEFISDDLLTDGHSAEESSPFLQLNMGEYTLHPRLRSLNKSQIDEAEDPVNPHISAAESLFREDLSTLPDEEEERTPQSTIWISYIENKALEEKFNKKKLEFQEKGHHSDILLYHGTSSANTDGICKTNFRLDLSVRFAYGRGIYLSKYPTTCLRYGGELIVCRVLLGRKQDPSSHGLKDGFDSKEHETWAEEGKVDQKPRAIVIRSVDQILPYCIISAEYPKAVKIGGRGMTVQQLKNARKGK